MVAAALLFLAGPLAAQTPGPLVLAGRLVHVRGADTTAVARATVVAHRVSTREQGPIDSMRTGTGGRFRFRVRAPDTLSVYMVSSLYQGIGYFSQPFAANQRADANQLTLAVFDTSSTGPPLTVAIRHLVVAVPREDGSREVLDIVRVDNPGLTTRVAADSLTPSWRLALPEGVEQFRVGEGEVSASAVRRAGDRLDVTAPFPPGQKQIVLSYVIPRGRRALRLPIEPATARLELLVEGNGARVGPDLLPAEPIVLEGRSFSRFTAQRLSAGARPALFFDRSPGRTRRLWWTAVLAAALALAGGGMLAARRRTLPRAAAGAPSPPTAWRQTDAIVRRIVALDERYQGREAGTPAAEWARYQARRVELKAELEARLAEESARRQIDDQN